MTCYSGDKKAEFERAVTLLNEVAPDLFKQILKQGFIKARVDGEMVNIDPGMKLDRYKTHDIEIVIDQIKVNCKVYGNTLVN